MAPILCHPIGIVARVCHSRASCQSIDSYVTKLFAQSRQNPGAEGLGGPLASLLLANCLPCSTLEAQAKAFVASNAGHRQPWELWGCYVSIARVRWPSVHSDAKIFLMPKRHANSPWASGVSVKLPPAGHSQFERYARKLSLTEQDYANSAELRRWCAANRNRCYIPEWLLKEWKMYVEPELS